MKTPTDDKAITVLDAIARGLHQKICAAQMVRFLCSCFFRNVNAAHKPQPGERLREWDLRTGSAAIAETNRLTMELLNALIARLEELHKQATCPEQRQSLKTIEEVDAFTDTLLGQSVACEMFMRRTVPEFDTPREFALALSHASSQAFIDLIYGATPSSQDGRSQPVSDGVQK